MKKKLLLFMMTCLSFGQVLAQSLDSEQWRNATVDSPYNVTFTVRNASCTGGDGWSRNSHDAAANYNTHNSEFDDSLYNGTCVESWYRTPVTGENLIWQTVSGLLPGTYRFTAYVLGQVYNDSANKGKCLGGLHLFANDSTADITSNTWQEISVNVVVLYGKQLTIGITADADNKNDWTGIANARLECLAPGNLGDAEQLGLCENYDVNCITADTYADVVLAADISSDDYVTLCLPFSVDEAQAGKYFEDIRHITGTSRNGNDFVVTTEQVRNITCGQTFLVKARKDIGHKFSFNSVFVKKQAPLTTTFTTGVLCGSYRNQLGLQGIYLPTGDGITFHKKSACSEAKAYSGFIKE
jgi:hypothetical protein